MKFYTKIITPYGEYIGETLTGTKDNYLGLIEVSKNFHQQESYYQYLKDGSFLVIGPKIIQESLMIVSVINPDHSEPEID